MHFRGISAALVAVACLYGTQVSSLSYTGISKQGIHSQFFFASNSAQPPLVASEQRVLLDRYCVTCHNDKLKTAGLMLDEMDVGNVGVKAEVWEKVIRKLLSGTMPPLGQPRPGQAAFESFISGLEKSIDRAAELAPNPGRPTIHRLNRAEYTNAIRDLLALDIDSRSLLPADDSGYGFDNIADVLKFSPGLLERYLIAAMKISRIAIGDPTIRASVQTYQLPYLTVSQNVRMSEDLPFGTRGGISIRHHFPLDGDYVFKIHLERNQLAFANRVRGLDLSNEIDVRVDGARIKLFQIPPRTPRQGSATGYQEDRSDADLEVRFKVKAGTRLVGVTFPRRNWYYEGVGVSRLPVASDGHSRSSDTGKDTGKIEATLSSVDISGPFDGTVPEETASRRKIFLCEPTGLEDEETCAKDILKNLARRAYRRLATEKDIQLLFSFYEKGRSEGNFDTGIQWALERILTDPDFLFRIERDPENISIGSRYRISEFELASRLSFFLWSSIPDDELLELAENGRLHDPEVLAQQVRRMLVDSRSKELVRNFFGQWLFIRNIGVVKPDVIAFPDFDENLREAFQHETELFLESQLHEDRSVVELLTANYTFVNERLAQHYEIPNIYGNHFRRVKFNDNRRAGLLGQGSLLTVTSYANRTSPVLRGKWLLENLLGAPPPPPPPNVPALEEGETGRFASMRERMEQHRKNPVCANCHSKLDPLGFALENFDGIGRWRATDANVPIDASGVLPNGSIFDGPAEFREALLSHQMAFITTLTEKLLTYALGRGVEYYDMPAIRQILRKAAVEDYSWSSLVVGIVNSMPFQMRRSVS